MNQHCDLLAPPPVELPADPAFTLLEEGKDPNEVVVVFPTSSLAWAELAEAFLDTEDNRQAIADSPDFAELSDDDFKEFELNSRVTAYAFARTGYHRGLDTLRGNGWKGFGPVPWSHEPNRGVLRAIAALALAAKSIGEDAEFERCRTLLADCDDSIVDELIDSKISN